VSSANQLIGEESSLYWLARWLHLHDTRDGVPEGNGESFQNTLLQCASLLQEKQWSTSANHCSLKTSTCNTTNKGQRELTNEKKTSGFKPPPPQLTQDALRTTMPSGPTTNRLPCSGNQF
jgi:hypothetical protein